MTPAGDRDAEIKPKTRVRRVLVRRKVQPEGHGERSRSPGATSRSGMPASTFKDKDGSFLPFMVLGDVREYETQVIARFGTGGSHARRSPPRLTADAWIPALFSTSTH